MSSLPIFDQLYAGMVNVFGQPGFVLNFMFLLLLIILLLVGLEGSMVGLLFLAVISVMAVYGLATYGYLGYVIIVVSLSLSLMLYRLFIK